MSQQRPILDSFDVSTHHMDMSLLSFSDNNASTLIIDELIIQGILTDFMNHDYITRIMILST